MGLLDSLKKLLTPAPAGEKLKVINVEKRFELLGRTGQGSMSKVWRARDKENGRTVCLKVLDKAKTIKFEARFAGLKRPTEGVICTALHHPNIVQTLEHGLTTEQEQYIVMELIEGMGLNFLCETKSPLLQENRVGIIDQIAEALDFMHRTGYLHRDICPRNVMVTHAGEVKLIDFGLTIPYTPEFCKPGNRTGTTNYMAPELIKRQSTDARVDLFALGVTAYEIFTGDLPWERAASLQILLSHMNSPGRDALEINPGLNKKVAKFLDKAIERDPRDRFQTGAEFREALAELQGL